MKFPRPKIHILDVSDPILKYENLASRCGVVIKNGKPEFMYGEDTPRVYQIGTCGKCICLPPQIQASPRYEYGVREAEEALHGEGI